MATKPVSDKVFNDALRQHVKTFGEGYDRRGSEDEKFDAIPTGYDDLDDILTKGARGIYLGGVIEFLGSEASGKSSLALRVVGNAQKMGHRCLWIDAETTFSESLAKINGCDPTKLIIPNLIETKTAGNDEFSFYSAPQILDIIYKSIVSNIYGVVVLDSVAGLMPARILEDDFDPNSSAVAEIARIMARDLPKIVMACHQTKTTAIFINQLRDQPGSYFQDRFHAPGGRAKNFFYVQRLSIEKIRSKEGQVLITNEDGKEEQIGHYARITIVKNKKAPPVVDGRTIEVPIYYREYFPDDAKKIYDLARKLQVVTLRNNILTWKENDEIIETAEGEASFLNKIRENKMESRLANSCVIASKEEKNLTRSVPISVPTTIEELGKSYSSSTKKVEKNDASTVKSDKMSTKKTQKAKSDV